MTKPKEQKTALQTVEETVFSVAEIFGRVAVSPSINFEREAEFAMQHLCKSDYVLNVAKANPQSVRSAVQNVAAIGISLNPVRKQAYLVPRKNAICLDISYMGLLDIAVECGSILWGKAELVYEADRFLLTGVDTQPIHERDPFKKDRGAVAGAYVIVKTPDGDYLTHTMTIDEIESIRNRSEAWKAYVKDNTKTCPWNTDPGEMYKKTVIKQASKTWPKAERDHRLQKAIAHLNENGEGIEFDKQDEPQFDGDRLAQMVETVRACSDTAKLAELWKAFVKEIGPSKDLKSYNALRGEVEKRGKDIQNGVTDVDPVEKAEPGFEEDFERQIALERAREGENDD